MQSAFSAHRRSPSRSHALRGSCSPSSASYSLGDERATIRDATRVRSAEATSRGTTRRRGTGRGRSAARRLARRTL
ncbi:MAG: hypothetical protein ACKO4O_00675 [Candidatus Limnocylindrus sp.]